MPIGPFEIVLLGMLALLVFFMFRNSRKRRAEQESLQAKMVPGVEVMTNFGLFGMLVSLDEENNIAHVEVSPGNVVRVHRQTLARVVEEASTAEAAVADSAADSAAETDVPEVQDKPARRSSKKKTDE